MTDSSVSERTKQFSDEYDLFQEYHYSTSCDELLIRGLETLVQLSGTGSVIDTMMLPMEDKLIAANRRESAWDILLKKKDSLILTKFLQIQNNPILLEHPEQDARTAVWSPCGNHIAVGNACNSTLSVWRTDTGKLHWKQAAEFEIEGEMINPPSLSVIGWSKDGSNIIACAEYSLFCSVIVLDGQTGAVKSIVS